jgi:hypothetical protein
VGVDGRVPQAGVPQRLEGAGAVGDRDAQFDHGAADAVLELGGGALAGEPAVVDDRDPAGELVGLLQVLSGQQHRGAIGGEVADQRPQVVAAGGIQAGGGLVQEQHAWAPDQGGGQVQAAAHPAGVGLDLPVRHAIQVDALEDVAGTPGAAAMIPDPSWTEWAARLAPAVAVEAVMAWLDAGQPDRELAARRIGQVLDGLIRAAQPPTR